MMKCCWQVLVFLGMMWTTRQGDTGFCTYHVCEGKWKKRRICIMTVCRRGVFTMPKPHLRKIRQIKTSMRKLGIFNLESSRSSSPLDHATFAPSMCVLAKKLHILWSPRALHSKAFVLNIAVPANKGIMLF